METSRAFCSEMVLPNLAITPEITPARMDLSGGTIAIRSLKKRKDAAGVILYVSERATQMALEAIQCLGGNGYINDYPAGRLLRDAKLYEIGAGTNEIRRMLIGRELFEETRP